MFNFFKIVLFFISLLITLFFIILTISSFVVAFIPGAIIFSIFSILFIYLTYKIKGKSKKRTKKKKKNTDPYELLQKLNKENENKDVNSTKSSVNTVQSSVPKNDSKIKKEDNTENKEIYTQNDVRNLNTNGIQEETFETIQTNNTANYGNTNYYKKDIPAVDLNKLAYLNYTKVRKLESSYTVLDFETTGLNPDEDEIIEVGAIKYVDDKEVDRFHSFVNPGTTITPFITTLTGITNNDVQNAPRLEDILPKLVEFVSGENIVAHNASFDMKFLLTKMYDQEFDYQKFRVIDTLPLARRTLPFLKNHKLPTLKEYLGINSESHNALDDCSVTGKLYQHCKEKQD